MKRTPKPPDLTPGTLVSASPNLRSEALPEPGLLLATDATHIDQLQARLERDVRELGLHRPVRQNVVRRKLYDRQGQEAQPNVILSGERTAIPKTTWRRVLNANDASTALVPATVEARVDAEADILNSYFGWTGIIEPEYDLLEPWTLIDVESFYKQSIERRLALAFRNGYEVTGQNQSFVKYINRRFAQLGFIMKQAFESFLKEVLLNLYICSNCIVVKVRDEGVSGGSANEKNANRTPIAAYKILPPQTIYPFLDGTGRIQKWRRFYGNGRPYRDYPVEDVMHFYWDRKPGHIFGTPKSTTFRDDIFALRRHEENFELLLVNHLFPLFHVKVGTAEAPAQVLPNGMSEIDVIKSLIQNMPKEGVFVTDERVTVEVHGAAKQGVDPVPLLEHYKSRVISGMGMSPLDLGIADTANRSTADNVSQNLKDSIISDLKWFGNQVKMFILLELFAESPSNLSVQRATEDVSIEFHEIDVDTQIKKETHALNKFQGNAISRDEMRGHMKMKPLEDEQVQDTHHHLVTMSSQKFQAKTQKDLQTQALESQASIAKTNAREAGATERSRHASTRTTKVSRKFANGGSHTKEVTEPVANAARNKMQPANQHGRNLDPHKARSSEEPGLVERIYDELVHIGEGAEDWPLEAAQFIDRAFAEDELAPARAHLKNHLGPVFDRDLLWAGLASWAENPLAEVA